MNAPSLHYREATLTDLAALLAIENTCFQVDKLSRRSFRHHISSALSDLWVAENSEGELYGYGLCLSLRGTRLARLYSLAVLTTARGQGVARELIAQLERAAAGRERLYMRLEVAKQNKSAIALYESCGYRVFGEYRDYYEDHTDALRMQKRIRRLDSNAEQRSTDWYRQSTEFTCGPSSLMMAMASLRDDIQYSIELELDLWREATTVFMTSGHGGCHPFGLALAAQRRGFHSSVWVNNEEPLFLDGVRSAKKKHIMQVVHSHFLEQCESVGVELNYQALSVEEIGQHFSDGKAVLLLISTYRLDGRKAPHWVLVTGMDDNCLFVHDPDVDDKEQTPLDCQYVPIAKTDVDKMAAFGSQRLRAAVILSLPGKS